MIKLHLEHTKVFILGACMVLCGLVSARASEVYRNVKVADSFRDVFAVEVTLSSDSPSTSVVFITSPRAIKGSVSWNARYDLGLIFTGELMPGDTPSELAQEVKYIEIRDCEGKSLEGISIFSKAQSITIYNAGLDEISAGALSALSSVEHMKLFPKELSNDALRAIGEMESLKYLEIVGGKLATDGLLAMGNISSLRGISLHNVGGFRIRDFSVIASWDRFESIALVAMNLNQYDLPYVARFKNLKRLDISANQIEPSKVIADLDCLGELIVDMNPLGATYVDNLRRAMPNTKIVFRRGTIREGLI